MDDDSQKLKPLQITLRSQYLSVDLARVRHSLESLISQGAAFFSKPLDNAYYEIVTNEGTWTEVESTPTAALKAFDLIKDSTHNLSFHISVSERTRNAGIPLIAEEYVYLIIDFSRRSIVLTISVRGLSKASEIRNLITEGIELVTRPALKEVLMSSVQMIKNIQMTCGTMFLLTFTGVITQ